MYCLIMNRPGVFYVTLMQLSYLKGSNEIDRFIPSIQGGMFSFYLFIYLFIYSERSEARSASQREFIIS